MSCDKKLIHNFRPQGIRGYKPVSKPNNHNGIAFFQIQDFFQLICQRFFSSVESISNIFPKLRDLNGNIMSARFAYRLFTSFVYYFNSCNSHIVFFVTFRFYSRNTSANFQVFHRCGFYCKVGVNFIFHSASKVFFIILWHGEMFIYR